MKNKTPPAPRYLCQSFTAWANQAADAITQGQTLEEFLARCHPVNRTNARTAYFVARWTSKNRR